MSWLNDFSGGTTPPYTADPAEPKVKDPSIPNRMVSDKPANRPFLAYKEYRAKQETLHNAWKERQKDREAKLARGVEVGPEEPDPTAQQEVTLLGFLKFLVYLLLFTALAGKFFTGSFAWEYRSKWLLLKTYWPQNQRLFSEKLLADHDGSVLGRPIYLAIDGDVYDVSSGSAYQPGGSYHILAGVDAARAFGTGCFQAHRTHDIRELSESELQSLNHWKKFYAEHERYTKVGRVLHAPIDPGSPIPEHCDPKKGEAQRASKARKKAGTENRKERHDEL